MALIKRLVLDVLKPHTPSSLELATAIADQGDGYRVTITVQEVDDKTETIEMVVEGEDIRFDSLKETIKALGGSLHSVDVMEIVSQ